MKPAYLDEWQFFVWRHRGPGNLAMHFVSFWTFVIAMIALAITWNPWLLVLVPVSQLVGFLGHYWFEDGGVRSRDFFRPQTLAYLLKIFTLIALGRYGAEMARVRAVVAAHNDGGTECKELAGRLFYGA